MPLRITWREALSWRLRRQLLEPVGELPAVSVVRRLCGVQAQVASVATLAVRLRQRQSAAHEVADALSRGELIKTWAMRGTLHLLPAADAGAFLSLLASGRMWERPSWVRAFGLEPADVERLRMAVREALDGAALTREELGAEVVRRPGLGHVAEVIRSGWGTVLKPLAFQGDLCVAPSQGNRVTFTRPELVSPTWQPLPDPAEAAPRAISAYLSAYGPASAEGFSNWLSRGRIARRQLRAWFAELGDRLAEVEVEGERLHVLAEDLDALAAAAGPHAPALRLLPGFDQWVLGPGTEDVHVVPPSRRRAVSRQSGWIAPVAVLDGVVSGTWRLEGTALRVTWFAEAGPAPDHLLRAEADRLGAILDRDLDLHIVAG